MIENILFPVDFSSSCVAIATYVKRAAAMFDARVTLVYVCDLASNNGFELYVRPPPGNCRRALERGPAKT
jgi:nucleotide-binding universal stress UspA family protein